MYIYFLAATEAPSGGSETLKKKFGFDDIFNSYYSYSTFPVRWKTGECKKAKTIQEALTLKIVKRIKGVGEKF